MISLPDVNVLLALAWSNHVHHEPAHRWFAAESARGWATSLPTQSGFVRLSLNPQIVGTQLSAEAVLTLLDALRATLFEERPTGCMICVTPEETKYVRRSVCSQ